ncbi:MAG: peptidoglycan-binding protein [Chloroflexota bacterium]
MSRKLALSILILVLAALACNLPQPTEEVPNVIVITATPPPITNTPVVLPSPIPTLPVFNTPTTLASPTPACNRAFFVSDVSYPDNTQVPVKTPFVKTWRLKNTGTCTWTSSYKLVFDSGDRMEGPLEQPLTSGTVAPGQTVDISVNLVAPAAPGTYRGYWIIRDPGGVLFGIETGRFWVQIVAVTPAPFLPDWPVLQQGDSGPEVWALQYLLRVRGQTLAADGLFGPVTRSAVVNFQTAVGLSPDGIVGPQTWSALIAGIQYAQGASGDGVRAIQTLLHDKFGETDVAIDGIFGPITAEAVRNFQQTYGLTVNGIVGPETWQALISY